jgi:hypothetical protein
MKRGLLGKIAAGKATEEDTVGVLGPKLAKMKELYGPGPPGGRLSALRASHSKPVLYGTFVWGRRAPNR